MSRDTQSRGQIDLSVIVPCFNEEGNLPELGHRIAATLDEAGLLWELILVDDGSADGSWATIQSLSSEDARIRGLKHSSNRGIAAAWRSGLAASRGHHICVTDADLQYQPEDIARLWRELHFKNVDIAQGVRNTLARIRDRRFLLSRGLNLLLNVLFGMALRDNKSGFLVTRRNVFADILSYRGRYAYFQTFVMVSAHSHGYTVAEVDTLFEERLQGHSFVSRWPLKIVANTLLDLARAVREFRLGGRRSTRLRAIIQEQPPARPRPRTKGLRRTWQSIYFHAMPVHHWMLTSATRSYYEDLLESQYLSPEAIKQYQEEQLRRLVEHAYYNVPYYREALAKRGLRPSDIRGVVDLESLPLLSKDDCRRHLYKGLIANSYDSSAVLRISTSGSTGEPFVCYADRRQLELRWAATQRSLEWAHYRFADPSVRLWHQTIGMSPSQVWREQVDAWFQRRLFIPVFEMNEASLLATVEKIRRHEPVFLDGYAEALDLLAAFILERGLDGPRPRGVMSSAQMLTRTSRAAIETAFGCQLFDKYGSREFSGIAYECEAHAGHHVVAENFIVEILKDGRPALPGETGEVIITDLNNYTMPLIRYRIGDLAVAVDQSKTCSCGRGLPLIGEIEGRVQSIIVGADGQLIPGTFFAHVFKDFSTVIRRYQILQERRGAIRLRIVKGTRYSQAAMTSLLDVLHGFLGRSMVIEVEAVERIELVRTGKHNAVVSKLRIDFQKGIAI